MKHILTRLALVAIAVLAVSCSKDYLSPEELFKDSSKVAKTTIYTKNNEFEDTVISFSSPVVYRKSDLEGKSWLSALSGGRKVYDLFMLSIYFGNIDNMKVGDTLKTSRFMFSFPASNDSNATTYTYGGKITLADKGNDYVILHFHKVSFNCSFGEYVIDGYLYCTLKDEFQIAY